MNIWRKKPVETLIRESASGENTLRKAPGALDLTMLGIGAIIGTGIFVLTGVAAAQHAGPALVLGICTLLYIVVSAILTGIVPYTKLDTPAPVALAMQYIHQDWFAGLISLGAIAGITTVLLVMLYGQTRIFFAMSRDGLLPEMFSKVHPRFKTPLTSTLITGGMTATAAGLVPIGVLAEMVNIGTLAAFSLVSAAVIIMRKTRPDLPRSFRCPAVPWVPALAIAFCIYLMASLPLVTWARFGAWLLAGVGVYFLYGGTHSKLNLEGENPAGEVCLTKK